MGYYIFDNSRRALLLQSGEESQGIGSGVSEPVDPDRPRITPGQDYTFFQNVVCNVARDENDITIFPAVSNVDGRPASIKYLFEVGSAHPTAYGMTCIVEACSLLLNAAFQVDSAIESILIRGHTSPEWANVSAGVCTHGRCVPCKTKFICNLRLSFQRAMSAYDLCYAAVLEGQISVADTDARSLTSTYLDLFSVDGVSSSEGVGTVAGTATSFGLSRRVEFIVQSR